MNLRYAIPLTCILAVAAAEPKPGRGPVPPLVRAIITEQRYCLGPRGEVDSVGVAPGSISLWLQFSRVYENTGTEAIIISADSWVSAIVSDHVLEPIEPVEEYRIFFNKRVAHQYVTRFRVIEPSEKIDQYFNLDHKLLHFNGDSPVWPFYAVIPPGRSVSLFDEEIGLRVYNPTAHGGKLKLLGKKIAVQLEFSHTELTDRNAAVLAKKWENIGTLWRGTVLSLPLEVDIARTPKFADCSHDVQFD